MDILIKINYQGLYALKNNSTSVTPSLWDSGAIHNGHNKSESVDCRNDPGLNAVMRVTIVGRILHALLYSVKFIQ